MRFIFLRCPVFIDAGQSDFLLTQVDPHRSIESVSKDSGGTTQTDNL